MDEQELVFILETSDRREDIKGARDGRDMGATIGKNADRLVDALQKRVPVSVHRLKANVGHLLDTLGEVFDQAEQKGPQSIELQEIELTVEVNAEGQVGILGTGGKAGGKGGITLKFKRKAG